MLLAKAFVVGLGFTLGVTVAAITISLITAIVEAFSK